MPYRRPSSDLIAAAKLKVWLLMKRGETPSPQLLRLSGESMESEAHKTEPSSQAPVKVSFELARLHAREPAPLPRVHAPVRRLAVYGCIVWDLFAVVPGRFDGGKSIVLPDPVASDTEESINFDYQLMSVLFGGIAANIAYGLGRLGVRPLLLGVAGSDFRPTYDDWLTANGVETSNVAVVSGERTSLFALLEDEDDRRITIFYPLVMNAVPNYDPAPSLDRGKFGQQDLVIITPGVPDVMLRLAEACRKARIPYVVDPSERMQWLTDQQLRSLVSGADMVIGNRFEVEELKRRTGWKDGDLLSYVNTLVTTRGIDGVSIQGSWLSEPTVVHPVVSEGGNRLGVGDAFRAGLFGGIAHGLDLERAAELGCAMAALNLEVSGAQGSDYLPSDIARRLYENYDQETVGAVMSAFPNSQE